VSYLYLHISAVTDGTISDQGMSERFSKFWMPLSEFTPMTMAALERGDEEIAIGSSAQEYEKYEKNKQGIIDKMFWAIKDRT